MYKRDNACMYGSIKSELLHDFVHIFIEQNNCIIGS
jgi:hypothetical protein